MFGYIIQFMLFRT